MYDQIQSKNTEEMNNLNEALIVALENAADCLTAKDAIIVLAASVLDISKYHKDLAALAGKWAVLSEFEREIHS